MPTDLISQEEIELLLFSDDGNNNIAPPRLREISDSSKNTISNTLSKTTKVLTVFQNGEVKYTEKTDVEPTDFYKIKSPVGVDLSHVKGAIYFRVHGLSHVMPFDAYTYMNTRFSKLKIQYFSKGLKKEIEDKFG